MWINCTLLASFPSSKTNCQLLVKKTFGQSHEKSNEEKWEKETYFLFEKARICKNASFDGLLET